MAAKLYLCALDDASAEMLDSPALLSVIVEDHVKINIIDNNHTINHCSKIPNHSFHLKFVSRFFLYSKISIFQGEIF